MFASTMRNHIEKKIPPQRKVDKILNNRPSSPRRIADIRTKQNQIILIVCNLSDHLIAKRSERLRQDNIYILFGLVAV